MRTQIHRFRYVLLTGVIAVSLLMLFATTFVTGPAVMQDGGYSDAAGRFTAPIPAGWTNASTDAYAHYTKDANRGVYIIAVEAADIPAGVQAALAIVAPDFDLATATLIIKQPGPTGNGNWQEYVYQASDGRIYYTDSQMRHGTVYLVITTAPDMTALMNVANDALGVIKGIVFAGDAPVTPTPAMTATPIPLYDVAVTLPAPQGEYAAGRRVFTWTDTTRPEIYSADPDDHRLLTVWAWYPADAACAESAPYMPDAMNAALKTLAGVDASLVTGHACADAALSTAQSSYPVLVFSHGNMSNSLLSSALLEDIASHGYIIFGIDHTYDALLTTLPDGQVIRALPEATPETAETLAMRVADMRFVLDMIDALNTGDDALAGHLDLAHISLIGHSFGGAAAAEACHKDTRCQSVVVIDVPLRGDVASTGLTQPIMLLDSERIPVDQFISEAETLSGQKVPVGIKDLLASMNQERDAAAAVVMNSSAAGYHIAINGTRHNSFTDVPVLMQQQPGLAANLGGITSIAGERGWRISSDLLLAFFGQTLRGEISALLTGPNTDYPEVVFEK